MLGPDLCWALLFLHSFTGWDTTAGFYGIGRSTRFKLFLNNPRLHRSSLSQTKVLMTSKMLPWQLQ